MPGVSRLATATATATATASLTYADLAEAMEVLRRDVTSSESFSISYGRQASADLTVAARRSGKSTSTFHDFSAWLEEYHGFFDQEQDLDLDKLYKEFT